MKIINVGLIFAVVTLSGCVTGTRNLENLDVPAFDNQASASGTIYIGSIEDNRQFAEKPNSPSTPSVKGGLASVSKEGLSALIGRQRNGFGAAMGDVALPEGVKVQDKVRELLTVGLESRGYQVVDDSNATNKISVDVEKFWAWFSPGFASISFESNLQCNIEFERPSGNVVLDVSGYGVNKGQVASNANWELAFARAFTDFLENLDKGLDTKGL